MLSREKVEAVLFKMGMPANVKGFGYIVDGVLLLEEDSKIKTTYLYFKVAQQHGTTGQRVERAIRHAFDIVRSCRGDYDVVNHYIGFINCANSPSLSMLTMKIREEALEVQEPKQGRKTGNKRQFHYRGTGTAGRTGDYSKTGKERRKCNYRNYRSPASGVNAAGIHRILGRYDYPVKEIKRNADRKQSAKTHQGYGVFWQADVFSRREP